jgi:hypothetical protein
MDYAPAVFLREPARLALQIQFSPKITTVLRHGTWIVANVCAKVE